MLSIEEEKALCDNIRAALIAKRYRLATALERRFLASCHARWEAECAM